MNSGYLVSNAAVAVFGMVLSASFCDIIWTTKKRLVMAGSMVVILMFQGMLYFWIDPEIVRYLYPFITHLPLALELCVLNKKWVWPVIAVLTSYLCCQLRRWLALLVITIFSGGFIMQNISELVLTVPILLILLRFVAPSVRSISRYNVLVQWQFGVVPVLYYGFDYLTRIYTNLLLDGVLVVVEFMPFVCSVAYLVFVFRIAWGEQLRSQLEQTQASLNLQVIQAVREIEALRESEQKTRNYRHDLHHHMQYLSSCIENGRTKQALSYIREICSEIEAARVTAFCENEAANLIFSSFAGRIRALSIPVYIRATIPQVIHVSESDLCVLLSNAFENALNACQKLKEKGLSGVIEVSVYEEKGKLFLQFINSCEPDIAFDHGIPVTDRPGHGIGVRSICAIVEKYGGIYDFSVRGNNFILRVTL